MRKEVVRGIRQKRNLRRKWVLGQIDKRVYQEEEAHCRRILRKAKADYELRLAKNIKSNKKGFLQHVNRKRKGRQVMGPLNKEEGDPVTDMREQAQMLNDYFASVFSPKQDRADLHGRLDEAGDLGAQIRVTPLEVEGLLRALDGTKAPGPDGLHPKITLFTIYYIVPYRISHPNTKLRKLQNLVPTVWSIETGKCLKTFGHKGIVWSAKMNDTHLVSACDRGIVKVWHAVTWILIKILQGHQGPVKCLSFDEWHLVTGSSDGYILGWSMLGKHKRCLVAFRHPMEVLHLGFLYLRVISGCADGKIRIFNFLTGTCLRVMRANSRGDPIMSFCIVENKLLINAQGSVVLFMFEEVKWDHSQAAEQVIKKQDRSKGDVLPIQMKPPPQLHTERQKRAKKTNWKLYSRDSNDVMLSYSITRRSARCSRDSPDLLYEMVKAPPPRKRNNVRSLDVSPDEKHRLSLLAKRYDLEDPQSITTLKGYSDDESDTEPPAPVSFCENAEAFIQYIRKRRPVHSISNDQMLLTIGTVQHVYKNDQVSANMAYNMKIKDAWGPAPPQKDQRKIIPAPPSPEQQKIDPPLQLKELMASGGSLGIERISTPYETRTLQVNLKNSLLGSSVKSSIPAPTITRSKSCSSLSGVKNAYTGHAKIPSPPGTGVQLIGHFTGSSESIKMPRMKIAQPGIGARSQPPKLFFTHTPNPLRQNTGFRLLTTQQMKQYAEEKISEYQANQTKVITNRKKECKNAWLRKIQGLPIDDFTKEGKISAPELGENVFI
ncbi:F-box/WD repeat-containing protein 10 [Varanus komodoensis]|nr:F-box/WD repeat-containing protein 10 [Varanus komodoensis]